MGNHMMPYAVPDLVNLLDDRNDLVRSGAAFALRFAPRGCRAEVKIALIRCKEDRSEWVRDNVRIALEQLALAEKSESPTTQPEK
jgi:hypothetical protein